MLQNIHFRRTQAVLHPRQQGAELTPKLQNNTVTPGAARRAPGAVTAVMGAPKNSLMPAQVGPSPKREKAANLPPVDAETVEVEAGRR